MALRGLRLSRNLEVAEITVTRCGRAASLVSVPSTVVYVGVLCFVMIGSMLSSVSGC